MTARPLPLADSAEPAPADGPRSSVTLDVGSITPAGIADFHWPVAQAEMEAFQDRALTGLAERARASSDNLDRDLLGITGMFFVLQALTRFQADGARERAIGRGRPVPALPPAMQKSAFRNVPDILSRGLPSRRPWLAPARAFRDRNRRHGIPRWHLRPADPRRHIICTVESPVAIRHAASADRPVVYRGFNTWFGPVGSGDRRAFAGSDADNPMTRDLIDLIDACYRAADTSFGDTTREVLTDWLTTTLAAARWHLEALLRHERRLPKRLWTGPGGNVWGRSLRHAVRRAGGHITSHDHWTSVGFLREHRKACIDLDCCDTYVTMTEEQARGIAAGARRDHLIQAELPELRWIAPRAPASTPPDRQDTAPAPRTLLYVMNGYSGGRNWLYPQAPDIMAIDWQARLLSNLRSMGFEITLKPHPTSAFAPPEQLAAAAGIDIADGPFEAVAGDADVLLFDHPLSTTFAHALGMDQSVVFIDLGFVPFTADAKALLRRRCAVVEGGADAENRLRVDWDALRAAIGQAPGLRDPSFFDRYFRY